jgi:hypothetical protein
MLYWRKPDGTYKLIDEVLEYAPLRMARVLTEGSRLLIPMESLVIL